MTDFTTPRTWNIGELITKAMLDVHVRDNINAVWVGTNAGDLDYYTASVRKARLAIGSNYKVLRSTGTAPSWDDVIQKCVLYKSANQTFNSGSAADIVWEAEKDDTYGWHNPASNPERVTVLENGWYTPFVKIYFNKNSGGTGNFHLNISVKLNGSGTENLEGFYESVDANTKHKMTGGHAIQMTAGQYLTAEFSQDSGGVGQLIAGLTTCVFTVYRVG
jgi:hypothetical protein